MSKYIGTPVVNVSVDTVDVTGDITTTDTTPEVIIVNNTHEDTDGGREGKVTFKGQQSGGEETTLAQIQASHDGTSDDEKGDLIFKTNDGSDGASPTEAMRIGSDQRIFMTRGDTLAEISMDANRSSVDQSIGRYQFLWNGTLVAKIEGMAGSDTTNKDDGQLRFQTRESGSAIAERMRIASDGKIGIGVTDPDAVLDISGVNEGGNVLGILRVTQRASGAAAYGLDVGLDPTLGDPVFSRIVNDTTTESFRIQRSSGIVLYGGISSGISAGVQGIEASGPSGYIFTGKSSTNARTHLAFFNPNGSVGSITTTGSATTYSTSSDHRLKENVTDVTDGITRVKQLAPKRFNFIADADTTVDGFLAHEAQAVVPEAVTGTHNETEAIGNITDGDGNTVKTGVVEPTTLEEGHTWTATGTQPVYQGIDQSKLVPLLTAALQEAIAKIETLETKVTALEGA